MNLVFAIGAYCGFVLTAVEHSGFNEQEQQQSELAVLRNIGLLFCGTTFINMAISHNVHNLKQGKDPVVKIVGNLKELTIADADFVAILVLNSWVACFTAIASCLTSSGGSVGVCEGGEKESNKNQQIKQSLL